MNNFVRQKIDILEYLKLFMDIYLFTHVQSIDFSVWQHMDNIS